MKNISLLHLHAENFKGINHIDIDFTDFNIVKGKNATGKTTLLDLFWWVLFGKDSQGRTDFQIRPVDGHGQMVDNVEIVGAVTFGIGDYLVTLKKVQTQVWTKKRGETAPNFSGNKNEMWVNGFPVSQKEYEENVAGILDEHLFKLMTNPMAFSMLPWKEQRQILLRFVAEVTDKDVLALDEAKYAPIADDILSAGADAAREKALALLKRLKKNQAEFPVRIDEAMRSKVDELPEAEVLGRRKKAMADLNAAQMETRSLASSMKDVSAIQDEIVKTKIRMGEIESEIAQQNAKARMDAKVVHDDALNALQRAELKRDTLYDQISDWTKSIAEYEAKIAELAKQYKEVKASALPEDKTICPTCGREFEADRIAQIREDFESRKQRDLGRIGTRGQNYRATINDLQAKQKDAHERIAKLTDEIAAAEEARNKAAEAMKNVPVITADSNKEYQSLKARIEELNQSLAKMDNGDERRAAIREREEAARAAVAQADKDLAVIEANRRIDARIEALKEEQRDCGQNVADAEQALYLIEEFLNLKMDTLSERINSHFKKVRFKLFKTLINGAVQPCCVMQMASNGSYVDYPNLNHGAQIIAGLDIIEALGSLYDVSTPVFIDNAEALSSGNQPETSSQLILLCVSDDEELTVISKYK